MFDPEALQDGALGCVEGLVVRDRFQKGDTIGALSAWLFQTCSIPEHVGLIAGRVRGKSPSLRGFPRALFRTRTGDPLLTMEVLYQLS
jgi:hypothetical protein